MTWSQEAFLLSLLEASRIVCGGRRRKWLLCGARTDLLITCDLCAPQTAAGLMNKVAVEGSAAAAAVLISCRSGSRAATACCANFSSHANCNELGRGGGGGGSLGCATLQ